MFFEYVCVCGGGGGVSVCRGGGGVVCVCGGGGSVFRLDGIVTVVSWD